jgi:serine/threonine protein kinase
VIQIPGYSIVRQLGKGGMATVYLAVQTSVDREVALKVMAPQLTLEPSFGERFLREARISAKLHHRHVVSVFDVGVYKDLHYIAMEFIPNGPVMGREGKPLDVRSALRCVREIAGALDYAHSKGFIHRDVKPDNILLRDDGTCVLSDFGIARSADSSTAMTQTGSVVGTPHYMSPEALRGLKIDGRADLYSLGVVFYQLLSGQVPYQASDSLAIGIMHMTAPLPAVPREYGYVQPLLQRMMAKKADERVQSGAEVVRLIQQIEAQLKDTPLPAPGMRAERGDSRHGETVLPELRAQRERTTMDLDPDTVSQTRTEPQFGRFEDVGHETWREPLRANSDDRARRPTAVKTASDESRKPKRVHHYRQPTRVGRWVGLVLLLGAGAGAYVYYDEARAWLDREFPVVFGNTPASSAGDASSNADKPADTAAALAQQREIAAKSIAEGRWFGSPDSALALFARLRIQLPDDSVVQEGYASAVRALGAEVDKQAKAQNYVAAAQRIEELRAVEPQAPQLATWAGLIEKARKARSDQSSRISTLLAEASDAFSRDRMLTPAGVSAVDRYRAVLKIEPGNAVAQAGLKQVAARLLIDARKAIERKKPEEALTLLSHAQTLGAAAREVNELKERAQVLRKPPEIQLSAGDDVQLQALLEQTRQAITSGNWVDPPGSSAFDRLRAAQRIARADPRVEQVQDELVRALEVGTDSARWTQPVGGHAGQGRGRSDRRSRTLASKFRPRQCGGAAAPAQVSGSQSSSH